MTAQIRGLNMAAKNAQDGLAMMATAENATSDVTDMLQRIRELAVQGANDTNSAKDREYLQDEVDALLTEINRVATQTRYNNLVLLDGQRTDVTVQVGTEADQTVKFTISTIDTDYLGLTWGEDADGTVNDALEGAVTNGSGDTVVGEFNGFGTGVGKIDLSDAAKAGEALTKITTAIEKVANDRAGYGAIQNRLEYTVSNLMNVSEFTESARSRIQDADFAVESARLAKAQVLQQSGTAMLAQANASSQLALQLVK
jgi:flagellin